MSMIIGVVIIALAFVGLIKLYTVNVKLETELRLYERRGNE